MFEHRPFGNFLKLSVRGASHAPAIEFTLENFPAGMRLDRPALQAFMERRAPGRDQLSTQRRETDAVDFVSGLVSDVTTGDAIVGRIANEDVRPGDYGAERTVPRPGHADFGQWIEQGRIPTGGGANSGRLTVALCAVGALCRQWLRRRGVSISTRLVEVGGKTEDFDSTIAAARDQGDSVGGMIACEVSGLVPGLGGALFAGVESELSSALFAIPGVKGVEFGNGFDATRLRGSENDDAFVLSEGQVLTESNNHGGILGGRTSGMPLTFRVAMKPTPTVFKALKSVDLATMLPAECGMKGRHDPCIVRRAMPVVEALTAFTLADMILARERTTSRICLTLTGKTLAEDRRQFESQRYFVDLVELRVDLLESEELANIHKFIVEQSTPVIVTYRRKSDGGAFSGPDSVRAEFFRTLLSRPLPASPEVMVDFEDDFRIDELTRLAAAQNVRIIRSFHLFEGSVPNLAAKCKSMVDGTDEVSKVAIMANNDIDLANYVDSAAKMTDIPHVLCVMGDRGRPSRELPIRSGSLWTYASVEGLGQLGHLSPYELVRNYRLRVQERNFDLYGVTGWPLKATRSPELHNAAFAAADRDAVMAAFPIETPAGVVAIIRKLGIQGMAVTIPHKESIMPLLDEISSEAQAIGAVNTIEVRDGRLIGHNTDAAGFSEAFACFLSLSEGSVPRKTPLRVAVLGAGGASKAVVYALRSLGLDYEVFHRRTPGPGFDAIVNATPVDPIPDYRFSGRELVYDLRYVPAETPLLARARAAGCKVENGFSMLMAQARRQREIWGCK